MKNAIWITRIKNIMKVIEEFKRKLQTTVTMTQFYALRSHFLYICPALKRKRYLMVETYK